MAKASDENGSDGEGRKLGEQTGLDTRNQLISGVSSERFVCTTKYEPIVPEIVKC